MGGKKLMMSCPERTRPKHLLLRMRQQEEGAAVEEDHRYEEVRINGAEGTSPGVVVVHSAVEVRQLIEVAVILPEQAAEVAEQQLLRIETFGCISFSISRAKTCCQLVFSSSPRSVARRMLRRSQTSITALQQKRVQFT
jgi:hypothetical protein